MAKPAPPASAVAQAPVVQTLVVRYAKRGRMRFSSHRDVARAVERAVRRAGLPIGYSAGFSPHPKISYLGGAPTGVASEAEYLRLGLIAEQDPDVVAGQLNAMLPDGLDIVMITTVPFSEPEASLWQVVLPDLGPAAAREAVTAFLARREAVVERRTDKGVRAVDARAQVERLVPLSPGPDGPGPRGTAPDGSVLEGAAPRGAVPEGTVLRIVIRHSSPAVRPADVLAALGRDPAGPAMVTRLAQGAVADLAAEVPAPGSAVALTGKY